MNLNKIKSIKLKETHLLILLLLTVTMFIIGLFMPMMTISKLVLFKNKVSVVSGAYELLKSGQIILFVIITAFSIILPMFKIYCLFILLSPWQQTSRQTKRIIQLMHEYGRWAMLDVFVVAVLIVTVKLRAIANVQVHAGLYLFAASVLLIMVITNLAVKLKSPESQ